MVATPAAEAIRCCESAVASDVNTRIVSNGATPVELAEQLGDSVQVALSTYASLFRPEGKLRAILEASYPAVGVRV